MIAYIYKALLPGRGCKAKHIYPLRTDRKPYLSLFLA